jgi:uncharacterized membrane protein (DUF2068 family)
MNSRKDRPKDGILNLIIAFKFLTVLLLIAVAVGAHHMMYRDLSDFADRLVEALRADPNNKFVEKLLVQLQFVGPKQLKAIGFGSLFYAAIELTEAVGLTLRKRWAEYFVVIATASFLPLEVIEICHKVSPVKIVMMIVNLLILGYLFVRLRKTPGEKSGQNS